MTSDTTRPTPFPTITTSTGWSAASPPGGAAPSITSEPPAARVRPLFDSLPRPTCGHDGRLVVFWERRAWCASCFLAWCRAPRALVVETTRAAPPE